MTDPVRGVIFDKDGTLFDFRTTWEAWAAAFLRRAAGGNEDHATRAGQAVGFDLAQSSFSRDSVVIAGTAQEIVEALAPVFPDMSAEALLVLINTEAARAPQAEAVPLAPLLDELRDRGLKLGVATNDSEAPARAHLDGAGVTARFDFVAGFDSGHGGKPGPGQLLAFCTQVDLDPCEVLMVGDSLHDLLAGRAAGMRCVAVLTGMATAQDLAPHAVAVLDDIGALPGWLDHHATR
ncbi:HAD family hydrolase [uncultured Tateyamaria sp.]|uniref:HAD family hydrolase n=1 Tax=Tateyamaria sp. 1078 TaxID=3417464 RepID=UPI00260AB54D|nr:HAD family hydrolase [uncultured Tateyamaria sp.]